MTPNWFLIPEQRPLASLRLFCLPYAGGTAAAYRLWPRELAPDIEVRAVQLPGRGWRMSERPATNLRNLAIEVADQIAASGDLPFAVFGHSLGAWLALEVVRSLESRGAKPLCLLASGRQAPRHGHRHPPISGLTDNEFVAEIQRRYGGIPAPILSEPDLLALLLPTLRADVAMLEGYERRAGAAINTPIHVLCGNEDAVVSAHDLPGWAEETTSSVTVDLLPGDHFYFQPHAGPLLHEISRRVRAADAAHIGVTGA